MNEKPALLPRRGFLARMAAAVTGGAWLAGAQARPAEAAIQDQAYIGEVRLFAGSVPPSGWMFCEGQLLNPNDETAYALFSLIGTTYGGDGQNTFALPDLRSRVPVHQGNGVLLGEAGGVETTTLTLAQVPSHAHPLAASAAPGSSPDPIGRIPARNAAGVPAFAAAANTDLSPTALQSAGGSQAHPNMQPYLGIHFMIAIEGIYPSPS